MPRNALGEVVQRRLERILGFDDRVGAPLLRGLVRLIVQAERFFELKPERLPEAAALRQLDAAV